MKRSNANEVAGPTEFQLEHFLPYRLSLLTNTVSQGIAQSYRQEHDISVIEWRILAVLGRFPGLTASEVVERTAMDKVAISRAVKSLMEKDLLQRKTDKADRRRMRLYITPVAGQQVLNQVIPRAQQYEQRLLETLDASEVKTLNKILNKLQERAKTLATF